APKRPKTSGQKRAGRALAAASIERRRIRSSLMLLPVFGIVTFQRHEKLVRLVNSIRAKYPAARIVIADNGRKLPARPAELAAELEGCHTVVLPFDCGLSAARNFLISHTGAMSGRPDLVILDDDY